MQKTSPTEVKKMLREFGLAPHKGLGQNFLIDANIRDKIIREACIKKSDTVLEIGPGLGVLTEKLAEAAGKLYAVEIDKGLYKLILDKLGRLPNLHLIHADILQIDLTAILGEGFKVVSNLPYNISTPVIMKLLTASPQIDLMVFMLQRELAQRLTAQPGSRVYGASSVLVQLYTSLEIVANVPRSAFYPVPQVDSTVLRLKPLARELPVDRDTLFAVVKAAFAYRRKTIRNSLTRGLAGYSRDRIEAAIAEAGVDPKSRAEHLSPDEFVFLAGYIQKDG